ncbi:unnamed protein product [Citrullus colocynthis]|uniref:Uncharacterized protein n=1 Tax=Citrullus colocynthis TaxID=252529 RepID=A0ABP0XZ04_9ROSI
MSLVHDSDQKPFGLRIEKGFKNGDQQSDWGYIDGFVPRGPRLCCPIAEEREAVAEVAVEEEEDCFQVRITVLVLVLAEAKDTVREKATERSAEAVAVAEEAVVEVGAEQGLDPDSGLDSDQEAVPGLEEATEAEAVGAEEEGEVEVPEAEMDQAMARDTASEADMAVGAAKEAVEKEEEEAAAAEVLPGVALDLVRGTGRDTDPDAEDGKKLRHESKCWIEISS